MLKNKSVRQILFIVLAVGILIPLINIYFIFPAFTSLIIKNTEKDAVHTAAHITSMIKREYDELTNGSIPPDLIKKVEMFQKDFQFLKLKLFSKNGEILYSTDPKDIGKVNDKSYFYEFVAKGNPYSKVVKKDTVSLEGKIITTDVAETYVPIMNEKTFLGAFKIYYDISQRSQELNNVVLKAGVIPFAMMLGGLTLTIIILIQLDKSITKQKKADEDLKAFAEKLQYSNHELESFAHIASHDLQEPLRKVIAFGDRIISKYAEVIDEQGRDYLRRMQDASRRMQTLINSLLSFSRVTTKAQPFVPVDLDKVTREVISDMEVGNLKTVDADPLQMRQLLQNLIGNALKFSKKDTTPIVKIHGEVIPSNNDNPHTYTSNGEIYQLTIEDNGIGFDEQYADRIFDVFQRLHGRKEYEGSGIGLSICRRIVDRHNGKIMAKSSLGEGAYFIVTLPFKQKNGGNNG
jgi:signal transduction histidine kinase